MGFKDDFRHVVMRNTPDPEVLTFGTDETTQHLAIPAHIPYVRVHKDHVDPDTGGRMRIAQDWNVDGVPLFTTDQAGNVPTFLKFLDHHEVVLPPSSDPPTRAATVINGTRVPNGDGDSLGWLPRMADLGTDATTIEPKYLDPVNPGEHIAAFVRMPNGRISTKLATDYKFKAVKPDDTKGSVGTLDQAAAHVLACEMSVPDETFAVNLRDFSGDGDDFMITFPPGEPKPWILVGCTSLEDTMQLRTVDKSFGKPDYHFSLLYGLAQQTGKKTEIALPFGIQPETPTGMSVSPKPLTGPHCVPARFPAPVAETGGVS
jgi:hypothetical protein